MRYYPVYLDLRGRRCVVIGGGRTAYEKARGLLQAGAEVTIIARDVEPDLEGLIQGGRVRVLRRDYRPGDLEGAFLVISAALDPEVNGRVWEEAEERGILINAVDDVPHCNFIAPSILQQGDLIVAISTSGVAPALAVRLRQRLAEGLGPEHARFLEILRPLRHVLAQRYPDFEERRAVWYRLVDSEALDLLRTGEEAAARALIEAIADGRETKGTPT